MKEELLLAVSLDPVVIQKSRVYIADRVKEELNELNTRLKDLGLQPVQVPSKSSQKAIFVQN